LLQQIINGISLGAVYALIAVGFSLVYSILSFSNFAHGGFLVVGAYICYLLFIGFDFPLFSIPALGSIWAAGAAALVGAGLIAVLTERLAYKPIREKTNVTLYLLIGSMGVAIAIENFFVLTIGGRLRALPPDFLQDFFVILEVFIGFFGLSSSGGLFELTEGVVVRMSDLLSFIVAIICLGGLQLFLTRTRWGLAIRAAAHDLRTAGLMGVNVALLIGIVFFVAGLLAGVAGIFLATKYTLFPQMGQITIKAFVGAVIGGLGSLPGAIVGSMILGIAEMLVAGYISSQMRDLVVFSMLVVMLLVRPAGIFGKQISDKV